MASVALIARGSAGVALGGQLLQIHFFTHEIFHTQLFHKQIFRTHFFHQQLKHIHHFHIKLFETIDFAPSLLSFCVSRPASTDCLQLLGKIDSNLNVIDSAESVAAKVLNFEDLRSESWPKLW